MIKRLILQAKIRNRIDAIVIEFRLTGGQHRVAYHAKIHLTMNTPIN